MFGNSCVSQMYDANYYAKSGSEKPTSSNNLTKTIDKCKVNHAINDNKTAMEDLSKQKLNIELGERGCFLEFGNLWEWVIEWYQCKHDG